MTHWQVGSGLLCCAALAQGCQPEDGRRGRWSDTAGDSALFPDDTGRDPDPEHDDPVPTGDFACYLGPEGLGDTCVPVVGWDPAWGYLKDADPSRYVPVVPEGPHKSSREVTTVLL